MPAPPAAPPAAVAPVSGAPNPAAPMICNTATALQAATAPLLATAAATAPIITGASTTAPAPPAIAPPAAKHIVSNPLKKQ